MVQVANDLNHTQRPQSSIVVAYQCINPPTTQQLRQGAPDNIAATDDQ